MREWNFQEKVYKRWVVLMIGPFDELLEALRKENYKYVDEVEDMRPAGINVRLSYDNSDRNYTIIWMPKFSSSVLVHELSHLVMATFNKTDIPITYDNEEAFAFYMEYWFGEINRVYKKYPKGRSAKEV
jgi:hypothetical protein